MQSIQVYCDELDNMLLVLSIEELPVIGLLFNKDEQTTFENDCGYLFSKDIPFYMSRLSAAPLCKIIERFNEPIADIGEDKISVSMEFNNGKDSYFAGWQKVIKDTFGAEM